MKFKNWKCYSYRFSDITRDYSYQELKNTFSSTEAKLSTARKTLEFVKQATIILYQMAHGMVADL